MPVYAETSQCAVKIVKRGQVWAVHHLDHIRCAKLERNSYTGEKKFSKCVFKWERKARETYRSQPFESKDVIHQPQRVIPHVLRMCSSKIGYDPFMRK